MMSDTDRVAPRAVERFTAVRTEEYAPGKFVHCDSDVEVVLASDYDELLVQKRVAVLTREAAEKERDALRAELAALKAENERLKAANEKLHDALEAYLSEIQDERDDLGERYRKERNDPASVKAQGAIRQPKAEATQRGREVTRTSDRSGNRRDAAAARSEGRERVPKGVPA